MLSLRSVGLFAALMALVTTSYAQDGTSASGRELSESLAPFEYLIGSWKGSGIPTANLVEGWNETHSWAWKFEKGKPIGLSVILEGGKVVNRGQLTPDADAKQFTFDATDPDGKAITFRGIFDPVRKQLILDRTGLTTTGAKQRITLFPNSNLIRYSLWIYEQEKGAPQYKRKIQAGMTKVGEAFAAGGGHETLPKCILTGGAATMTVTYQGKSYPVCCSGCRDEFQENPEKYIKKAALLEETKGKSKPVKTATSSINKDDGTFDGIVDEPKPAAKSSPAMKAEPKAAAAAKPAPAKTSDSAARAASLLRIGQNLEKSGKSNAALNYYHQVVKNHPGSPAAKTASERIKALTQK